MSEPASTTGSDSTTNGSGTETLAALSQTERAAWQLTGELPKREAPAASADPDDDEPEPATTESPKPAATTAPSAAKPEPPVSKRQQQINDLIRTRTEAEQRAAKLEARLAEVEGRIAKVSAADKAEPKVEAATPVVDPSDPEPDIQKYDDYQKYLTDFTRWQIRQDKREAKAAADKEAAEKRAADEKKSMAERVSGWIKRRDAHTAANPEKAAAFNAFLDGVFPGTPIGDTIMDSSVGAAIGQHLADHPDVLERIQSASAIVALRELGKLEAKFDTTDNEVTRASASAGPAAKPVTTAPAPPVTLGARASDTLDPLESALKDRDFRRWEAEANARDLAASKR